MNGWHPTPVQAAVGVLVCSIPAFCFSGSCGARGTSFVRMLPLAEHLVLCGVFRENALTKRRQSSEDYLSGDYFATLHGGKTTCGASTEHGYETCHPRGCATI